MHASSEDREGRDTPTMRGSSLLPFEFQALEACLESPRQCLDSEIPIFTEGKPQDFWRVVGRGSFANQNCHLRIDYGVGASVQNSWYGNSNAKPLQMCCQQLRKS